MKNTQATKCSVYDLPDGRFREKERYVAVESITFLISFKFCTLCLAPLHILCSSMLTFVLVSGSLSLYLGSYVRSVMILLLLLLYGVMHTF